MNEYEEKISRFITEHKVDAELLIFGTSCHSVEEAAASANASPEDFVKNICTIDDKGDLLVSIIPGKAKLDLKKVSQIVGSKVRFATAQEVLEKTGYPAGGTTSFGYQAQFLIDKKVLEKSKVYTGGGSQNALIKVSPEEIIRLNKATTVDITK